MLYFGLLFLNYYVVEFEKRNISVFKSNVKVKLGRFVSLGIGLISLWFVLPFQVHLRSYSKRC